MKNRFVGTLCEVWFRSQASTLDTRPRRFLASDMDTLRDLALGVSSPIELQRSTVALRRQIPWEADAQGRVVEAGLGWPARFGQSCAEAPDDGWRAMAHADDLPWAARAWRRAVAEGTSFDIECRCALAGGRHRWFRVLAAPGRDASISAGPCPPPPRLPACPDASGTTCARTRCILAPSCRAPWSRDTASRAWMRECGCRGPVGREGRKEACSFLKERTKELLPAGLRSHPPIRNPTGKVFLLLFLQKKKTLACLPEATSCREVRDGLRRGAKHAFGARGRAC